MIKLRILFKDKEKGEKVLDYVAWYNPFGNKLRVKRLDKANRVIRYETYEDTFMVEILKEYREYFFESEFMNDPESNKTEEKTIKLSELEMKRIERELLNGPCSCPSCNVVHDTKK